MTPCGPLVDVVLQRVRDPEGAVATRDFTRSRISDAQRLLNARFGWILDEATLVTEPLRIFYPVDALLGTSVKVRYIRQGNRDLVPVPWGPTWFGMRRGWPRAVGPRYEIFGTIGRDVVVVWPASRVGDSLTVRSPKLTAVLAGDADELEVHDEMVPMVLDFATMLVSLKLRQFGPLAEVSSSLAGRLKDQAG